MNERRTALCSIGIGGHARLLEITRPALARYASIHGYDLVVRSEPLQTERPPAWDKILLLRQLLEEYDSVVWIDSDAIVVDPAADILAHASEERSLWLTMHQYNGEYQPNTGVLVAHSSGRTRDLLDAVWGVEQLIHHPWWEQAALLSLLGYDVSNIGHARLIGPTEWTDDVGWLDKRWNSIPLDPSADPYVLHYPGLAQDIRVAALSRDARAASAATPDPHTVVESLVARPSVTVILPLTGGSAEVALASLVSLAESDLDLEVIMVDDGAHLRGVTAAVSGNVQVINHDRPFGLATAWKAGIARSAGDVVVLLVPPVVVQSNCISSLVDALTTEVAVTTATPVHDAATAPVRSRMLAARREDLMAVTLPAWANDTELVGEVLSGLLVTAGGSRSELEPGRPGRSQIQRVPAAVYGELPPEPSYQTAGGMAPWAVEIVRSCYADRLDQVVAREELPWVLEARGLFGPGVEVGVQRGLFSQHLLTYWGGRRLTCVDPWEHDGGGDYVDIANVGQEHQDALFAETSRRLAVFGDRSDILRLRSTDAAVRLDDGSLDFVYLDARHDYESVLEDLAAWVTKVRPGGLLAGHDYVDGDLPEGRFGVKRAVDEFFAVLGSPVFATTMDPPWVTWLVEVPAAFWSSDHLDAARRLAESAALTATD